MAHDVSAIQRRIQAEIPPAHRTARAMLGLIEATEDAGERALDVLMGGGIVATDTPQEMRMQLLSDLEGLGLRLTTYKAALAKVKPDDPMPADVRPLFYNIPGSRHFTPDYLVPFVVANQFEAMEEFVEYYAVQEGTFFGQIGAWMAEILHDAGEAVGKGAAAIADGVLDGILGDDRSSPLPWILGGTAAVVLVGGTVLVLRSRSHADRRV